MADRVVMDMNSEQAELVPTEDPVTVTLGGAIEAEVVRGAYEAYAPVLFGFLLHATHDHEVASDLLQETFLRLVKETRAGRTPNDPRAWLYRVAANLVRSRWRRMAVAQRWLHRLMPRGAARSPEDEYLADEQQREIADRLRQVPTEARLGLLMAAHGFSGPQVAAALGKSEAATRTLLCRARRGLRAAMTDEEVER